MDKAKIEEMERNAEASAQWLAEAREIVASDKGKSQNPDEELDTDAFQEYIQLHSEEKDYEYLVRGAKLNCRCGSHIRMLNLPLCHGVYIGENPMVHEYDCVQGTNGEGNISWFGICTAEHSHELPGENVCYQLTPDNNVNGLEGETEPGKKCHPCIVGVWQDVYDKTKIVDYWEGDIEGEEELCSLTTGSFLVCNYGGIIEPVTSGQEYVMTEKDLGLEDGKSKEGNIENEKEWEEIQKRREDKNAECGEADCSLAHERYRSGDNADHGNIHGTNYCTVVFQYQDGRVIDEQLVKKGDSAIAPTELEEREGFKFIDWDKEFTNIFEDTTITTMYDLVDITNKEAVQRYIWDFFIEKGFSEYMVAGILGNVFAESNFDCHKYYKGHYGLFQLDTTYRKVDLDTWVNEHGSPEWTDVQAQCEFAYYEYTHRTKNGWYENILFHVTIDEIELKNSEPIAAKEIKMQTTKENFENSESPTEAAMIFAAAYERCPESEYNGYKYEYKTEKIGDVTYYIEYQDQQKRCEYAELYYRKFSGE